MDDEILQQIKEMEEREGKTASGQNNIINHDNIDSS
jgi:hypothetical protein